MKAILILDMGNLEEQSMVVKPGIMFLGVGFIPSTPCILLMIILALLWAGVLFIKQ